MNAPATTLPSAASPELGPDLPHDVSLEPKDETIAELQSLVCKSRQIEPTLSRHDLIISMSAAVRQLIEAPTVGHATALAAFALRYREEQL